MDSNFAGTTQPTAFSRSCFVTGTDTGIGKTVITAALVSACRAAHLRVAARKPVLSGLDEEYHKDWPPDHQLLADISQEEPETIAPSRYGPPVSPHLARDLAGEAELQLTTLVENVYQNTKDTEALIVEGVGGLLVPFSYNTNGRDLAKQLGLPVIIVARTGLGTINHTLLTLEAARNAGLDVRAVVLNQWPTQPTVIEQSNQKTLERIGEIEVATFPQIERPSYEALLEASAQLPWQRWLTTI